GRSLLVLHVCCSGEVRGFIFAARGTKENCVLMQTCYTYLHDLRAWLGSLSLVLGRIAARQPLGRRAFAGIDSTDRRPPHGSATGVAGRPGAGPPFFLGIDADRGSS